MKVLVVTESPAVWGAEQSLLTLAESRPEEIDLTFAIGEGSPLADELRSRGLAFQEVPFLRATGMSDQNLIKIATRFFRAAGRLRSMASDADVVLSFSAWQLPEAFAAAALARRPLWFDLHETFSPGVRRRLLSLALKFTSGLLAPSRSVLDQNKVRRNADIVFRPVIPPRAKSPLVTRSDAPFSVGIVGQIVPHKRVLELIRSVPWAHLGMALNVIGGEAVAARRTDYEREVREAIAKVGGESKVVDRTADVYAALAAVDVLVNCSQHEAFGRTVAEAAMVGTEAVVVGHHGPAEIVAALGRGYVVESMDGVAAALERARSAANDSELSNRLISTAGRMFDANDRSHEYWTAVVSGVARRQLRRRFGASR